MLIQLFINHLEFTECSIKLWECEDSLKKSEKEYLKKELEGKSEKIVEYETVVIPGLKKKCTDLQNNFEEELLKITKEYSDVQEQNEKDLMRLQMRKS